MNLWPLRCCLALLGLVAPVLALECTLRTLGPSLSQRIPIGLDQRRNLSYFEPHPIFGLYHIPETTSWHWTPRYVTRVDINSRGLREREIDYAKPAGTRRVLVLGDSFVEAAEVPVEATFSRRLESLFHEQRDDSVTVINAGVLGFGTAQEYLLLRHEGLKYDPDLVVLVFFGGNDVSDNSVDLDYPPVRAAKPYFEIGPEGHLRLRPFEPPARPSGPIADLRRRLRRESLLFGKIDAHDYGGIAADPAYFRSIVSAYSDTPSADLNAAWQVTEALLQAIHQTVRTAGARFLLVYAPAPWEVDGESWETLQRLLRLPPGGWDLDGPNRRVLDIARRGSIPHYDLGPELRRAAASGEKVFIRRDGHWTVRGHEIVARALLESGLVSLD